MMNKYKSEQFKIKFVESLFGIGIFGFPVLYRLRNKAYAKLLGIPEKTYIGNECKIYRAHKSDAPEIKVGKNVFIGDHVTIDYCGAVIIEDGCEIAEGVKIYSHKHDVVYLSENDTVKKEVKTVITRICTNAYIGAAAIIMPGVCIGRNAVIYSGAVVMNDVEDYGIVAGNPAKNIVQVIRELRKQ